MIHNFAEKNEEFMVEFGKILLKHHRDMARVAATIEGGCDQAALNFARYLRAARANASLSPEELAQQADIPRARDLRLRAGANLLKAHQSRTPPKPC